MDEKGKIKKGDDWALDTWVKNKTYTYKRANKYQAKSQALKAAKTGKLPKFGTNNMETRRKLMGKKSTTEHFEQ